MQNILDNIQDAPVEKENIPHLEHMLELLLEEKKVKSHDWLLQVFETVSSLLHHSGNGDINKVAETNFDDLLGSQNPEADGDNDDTNKLVKEGQDLFYISPVDLGFKIDYEDIIFEDNKDYFLTEEEAIDGVVLTEDVSEQFIYKVNHKDKFIQKITQIND